MTFASADLDTLTRVVVDAWHAGRDRDWSALAGTLEWTCSATADHAVDCVIAPAFFLASQKQDAYPEYGVFKPGPDARPELYVEALSTATRILTAVVAAADPGTRAIIWRRPQPETRPPADFVPRGAFELILHAHDVCAGLGVAFAPPDDLCERLVGHTIDWPMWEVAGWTHLPAGSRRWSDLRRATGRLAIEPT
jgi:hypothetical protein